MAYWAAQIVGWSAYYILSVALILSSDDTISVDGPLTIWIGSSIVGSILITHFIRWYIIKWDVIRAKVVRIIIVTLVLSTVAALLLEAFQYFLDLMTQMADVGTTVGAEEGEEVVQGPAPFDVATFLFATTRSIILFMLWMGFYFAFTIIDRLRKQEIERLKYDASMNEIELKNLRAQLNPHFLFNSLNSIRALVGIDPEQAKDAITKLSGLLRQSINMGKQGLTTIKEEMELVSSYLKLEKIRFEERLEVEIKMNEEAGSCEIPPLMIQTLVENAIKHGISKSINGGIISIEIQCDGKSLIGHVKNTGVFQPEKNGGGMGLLNTKKRLELLYGDRAQFNISQVGEKVHADFSIFYDNK